VLSIYGAFSFSREAIISLKSLCCHAYPVSTGVSAKKFVRSDRRLHTEGFFTHFLFDSLAFASLTLRWQSTTWLVPSGIARGEG